jgi:cell wall-associated NlpC family hydrolase
MEKLYIAFICTISFGYGIGLIQISDNKGKVIVKQDITHCENDCINQKASEYSLQALYDELHKEERMARLAALAKQKVQKIKHAQAEAKKHHQTYNLSIQEREALTEYAKYFKGGRYIWGGTTPTGFDCSGYVQYLYKKQGINLPRTALEQSKVGTDVSINELKKGDLLFFLTDKKRKIPITHVGIYIGNGEFIHAASRKKGIIISPITHGYYAGKFVKAKRIIKDKG